MKTDSLQSNVGTLSSQYPLGNTDAEHERLIRQAARLNALTERLFRDAGPFASNKPQSEVNASQEMQA